MTQIMNGKAVHTGDYSDLSRSLAVKIDAVRELAQFISESPEVSLDEAPQTACDIMDIAREALALVGTLDNLHEIVEQERDGARELAVEVRGYVIAMRRYIKQHGIRIGECVGWNNLKRRLSVGQTREGEQAEEDWAREKGYIV